MIKKSIKSFNFVERNEYDILVDPGNAFTPNGDLGFDIDITFTAPPNEWQVHLDRNNVITPQFVLDADGTVNVTGHVQSLGAVIFDQIEGVLKFWDGRTWIPINI